MKTRAAPYNFQRFVLLLIAFFSSAAAVAEDTLRFVSLDFAPFVYVENQSVSGPGYEIISTVCERVKINCTYDIYPWRRAQNLIKTGLADGMMSIGRNPDREKWVRFTPPYIRTEQGIFVKEDNPLQLSEMSTLAGLRIGVFAPSNAATQLSMLSDKIAVAGHDPIDIEERPDDASGFRKLAAGRLDAVYSNRDRGNMILELEGLQDKVRYAGSHQEYLLYAGFMRSFSNIELLDRFDNAWEAIFQEGKAQSIIEKYGLEPARVIE